MHSVQGYNNSMTGLGSRLRTPEFQLQRDTGNYIEDLHAALFKNIIG